MDRLKLSPVVVRQFLAALGGTLCLAYAMVRATAATNAAVPAATGFIEKFEVPERDENGNLKWRLRGDKAQIGADGRMKIFNVHVEFFSSNQVDFVFSAPHCTLDQANRRASTDGPVRLERAGLVVTGDGADWTGADNSFVVRSNVHVVISPARSTP